MEDLIGFLSQLKWQQWFQLFVLFSLACYFIRVTLTWFIGITEITYLLRAILHSHSLLYTELNKMNNLLNVHLSKNTLSNMSIGEIQETIENLRKEIE